MSHNAVVHIFLPVDLATALRLDPPCVYQRAPEGHRPLEADSLAAPLEMSDDNLGLRQSSAVIRDTSHISRKQFHLSLQDTVKAALHRAAEIKSKYSRLLPDIQTDLAAQINAIQSGYRPDQFDIAAWSLLLLQSFCCCCLFPPHLDLSFFRCQRRQSVCCVRRVISSPCGSTRDI